MGSKPTVNRVHFNSCNLFMKKKTTIMNKIISYSPNNTCNIFMGPDIMFNGEMLECFDQLLKSRS